MKRNVFATLILLGLLLMVSVVSCKKAEPTSLTDAAESKEVTADVKTTVRPVKIQFYGTMSQLLGDKKRAVLLRGKDGHRHEAKMTVSEKDIAKSELEKIWSGAQEVNCIANRCTVSLEDTALQFASKGVPISATSITTEDSFKELVPHLRNVTNSAKFDSVKDEALSDDRPVDDLITTWVALPDGTFSAVAYNWIAKFEKDHEGIGERYFAREVILDSDIDTPSLQVNRDGTWKTLPFLEGSIEIKIFNAPLYGTTTEHFNMHYDLAKIDLIDNTTERPDVKLVRQEHGPAPAARLLESFNRLFDHGKLDLSLPAEDLPTLTLRSAEVPGCSNSQWP